MARKQIDHTAAKAKKQKTILIVMGVALLGLGAIQGPKLWKQLNPPAAAPAPAPVASAATGSPSPAAAAAPPAGTPSASGPRPTALLAGVTITTPGPPVRGAGQLRSFTLFTAKDPFVPQASDELSGTTTPTAEPTLSDTQPGAAPGTNASAGGGAGSGTAAPAPKPAAPTPTYVTVSLNGKAYALVLKDAFPKADPLFVVTAVKPELVRIGVAGGSFADGKTIPVKLGQKVVLVNDATGARYVLRLLYTGAAPEQVESFTQAGK